VHLTFVRLVYNIVGILGSDLGLPDNNVGHRPSSSPGKCVGSVHLTFVRLLLYSIVGILGSDLGL
jgi:hypothetical protein